MAIAKSVVILILCFALACNAYQRPRPDPIAGPDIFKNKRVHRDAPRPNEKIFNIKDFGAVDDGETDNRKAFADAWRTACHEAVGPARLLVPPGRYLAGPMYFEGPCNNASSPLTIEVRGTILASPDISDFANIDWIFFKFVNGLKIFGGGIFDGQGKTSWEISENCESGNDQACTRNSANLYFAESTNVLVQGIRSVNPKGFHLFVTSCTNVRLRNLKLIAPETSPNTDGIHVSHSDTVIISRNTIATGDDCISMIQGSKNVFINKLKCGPGHGISIGSLGKYEDEVEVKGISIKNCTLTGTTNGLRIKSWPDRYPGAASDISFSDIIMQDVKNPIIIDQEYECEPAQCTKKPSLVKIQSVHFSNIRGTTTSPLAVDLRCSKLFPCTGVTFQNVDLKVGLVPTISRCMNTKPLFGGLLIPPAC